METKLPVMRCEGSGMRKAGFREGPETPDAGMCPACFQLLPTEMRVDDKGPLNAIIVHNRTDVVALKRRGYYD